MIRKLAPAYEPCQPRIALVDHDQDFVDKTSANLNAEGFICRGFASIDTAATAAALQAPDLMLLGTNLPGIGGLETVRRVRSNPILADLPAIFLSATQVPDIIHRCDEGHGSYSVRKALEIGVLVELIESMLPTAVAAGSFLSSEI